MRSEACFHVRVLVLIAALSLGRGLRPQQEGTSRKQENPELATAGKVPNGTNVNAEPVHPGGSRVDSGAAGGRGANGGDELTVEVWASMFVWILLVVMICDAAVRMGSYGSGRRAQRLFTYPSNTHLFLKGACTGGAFFGFKSLCDMYAWYWRFHEKITGVPIAALVCGFAMGVVFNFVVGCVLALPFVFWLLPHDIPEMKGEPENGSWDGVWSKNNPSDNEVAYILWAAGRMSNWGHTGAYYRLWGALLNLFQVVSATLVPILISYGTRTSSSAQSHESNSPAPAKLAEREFSMAAFLLIPNLILQMKPNTSTLAIVFSLVASVCRVIEHSFNFRRVGAIDSLCSQKVETLLLQYCNLIRPFDVIPGAEEGAQAGDKVVEASNKHGEAEHDETTNSNAVRMSATFQRCLSSLCLNKDESDTGEVHQEKLKALRLSILEYEMGKIIAGNFEKKQAKLRLDDIDDIGKEGPNASASPGFTAAK